MVWLEALPYCRNVSATTLEDRGILWDMIWTTSQLVSKATDPSSRMSSISMMTLQDLAKVQRRLQDLRLGSWLRWLPDPRLPSSHDQNAGSVRVWFIRQSCSLISMNVVGIYWFMDIYGISKKESSRIIRTTAVSANSWLWLSALADLIKNSNKNEIRDTSHPFLLTFIDLWSFCSYRCVHDHRTCHWRHRSVEEAKVNSSPPYSDAVSFL